VHFVQITLQDERRRHSVFGVITQLPDKGFYLLSLLAYAATHRKRQTYYNLPDLVLANNVNDSLYVCPVIPAVDNGQWASQYALWVAESHPNPLIADIKP